MDAYFRAVGFSKIRLDDLYAKIKDDVISSPQKSNILGFDDSTTYAQYYKLYGKGFGLHLKGTIDDKENILTEELIPYAIADKNTTVRKYLVEDTGDELIILYEDDDTGNELLFKLQNDSDYFKDNEAFITHGLTKGKSKVINVAALSIYGTVILPVVKDDHEDQLKKEEEDYYKNLVYRFRDGDDEAEDLLKLYAEETSDIIQQRLKDEDFLSVVEGYFLPMEDNELDYSILGDILSVEKLVNSYTEEIIYKMLINVTGTVIQLFVNEADIVGLPIAKMRFMGTCRLQGRVVLE